MATMGDSQLLLIVDFAERASVGWIEEDRVVTEPA
jgi:hypothetical protein